MNKYDISAYQIEILKLQKICLEQEGYENLLAFLLNNNMNNSEYYAQLWEEYINLLTLVNQEKDSFFINVVSNFIHNESENKKWEVKFNDKVLYIW